jgi:hypothetical protein
MGRDNLSYAFRREVSPLTARVAQSPRMDFSKPQKPQFRLLEGT